MYEDINPADYAQTSLGGTPAFVKLAPGDKGDGFPLNILKGADGVPFHLDALSTNRTL